MENRTDVNFGHIFSWKLLSGSHDFPGPDGGTCINEAAIIAAGFEYRKVGIAQDCPPCFSRPIASYAISLNDKMPDALRQNLLMPFVTRLAGTADTPEVEQQRAEFIFIGLVGVIISMQASGGKNDLRVQFSAAPTLADAQRACEDLAHCLAHRRDRNRARNVARNLAHAISLDSPQELAIALVGARAVALAIVIDLAPELEVFEAVTRLLDGALKIGKKPMPLDAPLVEQRMDIVKRPADTLVQPRDTAGDKTKASVRTPVSMTAD
jgi:hypothetical protein